MHSSARSRTVIGSPLIEAADLVPRCVPQSAYPAVTRDLNLVVDEAVRLVRRYASDEGGGLVNGILGAVLREMQRDGRAWSAPAGAVEEPEPNEREEAEEAEDDDAEDW